jgi:hypothetical protein
MWRVTTAFVACLMVSAGVASAQVPAFDEPDIQINFVWAVPQGQMADHIHTPIGMSVMFGDQVPGTPLFLGTELSLMNYGHHRQLEIYSLEGVPVQALGRSTQHNIASAHLVARFQLPAGGFEPYVDVLGGVRSFVTHSRVDSDVIIFPKGFAGSARMADRSFSYGFGGGFDLHLYSRPSFAGFGPTRVSLNAGVRYLLGGDVEFVRDGGVMDHDGRIVFDTARARSEFIIPHVGVHVGF